MALLERFNETYDLLQYGGTFNSNGRGILIVPYDREYRGLEVYNYTKAADSPTGANRSRFFYKNVPEQGNQLLYTDKFLNTALSNFTGISTTGILLTQGSEAPIVATAITKASPGVVTAANHGLSVGQMIRCIYSDMNEMRGAVVQVIAVANANTFSISANTTSFINVGTDATFHRVAPGASHNYKVFSVTQAANAVFTLSNVIGLQENAILTLATNGTTLESVDGQRVRILSVNTTNYTVTTDLNTTNLGSFVSIVDPGEITALNQVQSLEPNPELVDVNRFDQGGVLILPGATNPAGESGDLLTITF